MSRLSALILTLILGSSVPLLASAEEGNLGPRITQRQVEDRMSLKRIRREGLRIFSTPFNKADGHGDGPIDPLDSVSPGGRPTFKNHGHNLRMNGLDSQTCLECHNYQSTDTIPFTFGVGGVGALSQNAYPGVIDPDLDDSEGNGRARIQGRVINPPFSFGSGGVELLAKEMTQTLQAQKQRARENPNTLVDLVAKGVRFGQIAYDGEGFDLSDVEGVEDDLVIRPFGRTGCCATVRDFDNGAFPFHMGIELVEVVGEDVDSDGDGVVNELLVGELSAVHIFQTSLERPRQKGNPGKARQERLGAELFEEIGCADCHIPKLFTDKRHLPLSFPEVHEDPSANVYFRINLTHAAPGFKRAGSGVEIPLFADLKLHDMGPDLTEEDGNSRFTTARLWGIADTAPYLHDGRALTLTEAISQHGGEAQPNADAFDALNTRERSALLAFLETLRTPRHPNRGL